jgi:hypothetical protein
MEMTDDITQSTERDDNDEDWNDKALLKEGAPYFEVKGSLILQISGIPCAYGTVKSGLPNRDNGHLQTRRAVCHLDHRFGRLDWMPLR